MVFWDLEEPRELLRDRSGLRQLTFPLAELQEPVTRRRPSRIPDRRPRSRMRLRNQANLASAPVAQPDRTNPPAQGGVLVADDDAMVLDLVAAVLERHGFKVWSATTGEDALDLYRRHQVAIDRVLLDVNMPGLDGVQTLSVLRRLNPAIRCGFMTGYFHTYSQEQLCAAGAVAVLAKPFELAELVRIIEQLAA